MPQPYEQASTAMPPKPEDEATQVFAIKERKKDRSNKRKTNNKTTVA